MKTGLNKEQALDLIKVLSHYLTLDDVVQAPTVHRTLGQLEKFVLYERKEEDDEKDEAVDCENEVGSREEDEEEPREQEAEASPTADDSGPEDDEDDPSDEERASDEDSLSLKADRVVDGSDLHYLKVIKGTIMASSVGEPGDLTTLEFEHGDRGEVDLLVDGVSVGPLIYVKRRSSELHVAARLSDDRSTWREWHRFSVSRYSKGWTDLLPLDELCEVRG